MSKNQRKIYASFLAGLLFSATALSAEQVKIVEEVKNKIPLIVNVKDRQLVENFVYENFESLDRSTVNSLTKLIGSKEGQVTTPAFNKTAYIQAIVDRAAGDISFRESLELDGPSALAPYIRLTPKEIEVISSMRRVGLEELGIDVSGIRAHGADNGFKAYTSDLK